MRHEQDRQMIETMRTRLTKRGEEDNERIRIEIVIGEECRGGCVRLGLHGQVGMNWF